MPAPGANGLWIGFICENFTRQNHIYKEYISSDKLGKNPAALHILAQHRQSGITHVDRSLILSQQAGFQSVARRK
ncbi:hypothetical protein THIARS_90210 [Thiomonas delicata]|uniref:Uncharacterized protein n=1 Tax=Thiomonas delicata TaxID=364030 RepID=A0A238DA66_THIDL|nr:hypothetical protein THIARS_90210 [Thiomonas delicata]